jgi:HEAT repeat protein
VATLLRGFGLSVFFDRDSLGAGKWAQQLRAAIQTDRRPVLVVIATMASCASGWVRQEVQWALDAHLTILPVELEPGSVLTLGLESFQMLQLSREDLVGQSRRSDAERLLWKVLWNVPLSELTERQRVRSARWCAEVVPVGRPDFWGQWWAVPLQRLESGNSVVLTAPGGSGKSVVAARLVEHMLNSVGGPLPIVVPEDALVDGCDAVAELIGAPNHRVFGEHVKSCASAGLDLVFVVDSVDRIALSVSPRRLIAPLEMLARTGRLLTTCREEPWAMDFEMISAEEVRVDSLPRAEVERILSDHGLTDAANEVLRVPFYLDAVLRTKPNRASRLTTRTTILQRIWRDMRSPVRSAVPCSVEPGHVLDALARCQWDGMRYEVDERLLVRDAGADSRRTLAALVEAGVIVGTGHGSGRALRLRHDLLDCFAISRLLLGASSAQRAQFYAQCDEAIGWPVMAMLVQIASDTNNDDLLHELFSAFLKMLDCKRLSEADMQRSWAVTYVLRDKFEMLLPLILVALKGSRAESLTLGSTAAGSCLGTAPKLTQEAASSLASAFHACVDADAFDAQEAALTLEHALKEWPLRRRFIDALATLPGAQVQRILLECAERELEVREPDGVLAEIARALGECGDEQSLPTLTRIADAQWAAHRTRRIARESIAMLSPAFIPAADVDDEEIIENLALMDSDGNYSDWRVVVEYAEHARRMAVRSELSSDVREKLIMALDHGHTYARVAVAKTLGDVDTRDAWWALVRTLSDPGCPLDVRSACLDSLRRIVVRNDPKVAAARLWSLEVARRRDALDDDVREELVELIGGFQAKATDKPIVTHGAFEWEVVDSGSGIDVAVTEDLLEVDPAVMPAPTDLESAGAEWEPKYAIQLPPADPRHKGVRLELVRSRWQAGRAFHLKMERSAEVSQEFALELAEKWLKARVRLPGIASVHAILLTADDHVVLARRSESAAYSPGAWSPSFEEQLTVADVGAEDPFVSAALRGCREEFGELVNRSVTECQVIGVALQMPLVNPCVVALLRSSMGRRSLEQAWGQRLENGADRELSALTFVAVAAPEETLTVLGLHPTACLRLRMLARSLGGS